MKFTVVWKPAVERALTEIWLSATDRNAVSRAASEIDHALQVNPEEIGESRDPGRRILFAEPLGVIFSVKVKDRRVLVLRVWRTQRRTR